MLVPFLRNIPTSKKQARRIKTGAKNTDKTEVISDELQENDKVIVRHKNTTTKPKQGRPMRMF